MVGKRVEVSALTEQQLHSNGYGPHSVWENWQFIFTKTKSIKLPFCPHFLTNSDLYIKLKNLAQLLDSTQGYVGFKSRKLTGGNKAKYIKK
jgi:hypothetical protein